MTLRRIDARFLLPHPVRRAVVLPGIDGWEEELERAKARGASSEELAKLEAHSAPRVCKGPGLDANHS